MEEATTHKLTKEQESVVTHDAGPLLIVAGPGSGKTEVMTRRVAHLIAEKGVNPERILVVTFTNKAADELKDRIQEKVGTETDIEHMQVSTIHSFCNRILTENIKKSPLKRGLRILDGNQQFLFVYANRKELALDVLKKGRIGDFVREVISTYNKCTEFLVSPEQFIAEVTKQLRSEKDEKKLDYMKEWLVVAESYGKYCDLLLHRNFVDFSFLLKHVYDILDQDEDVLKKVQSTYEHVLIDEYQDTNRLQHLLLKKVTKPEDNICVVGDDDQSIYRFRGASVRNFLDFRDEFRTTKELQLARNFRSTRKIVDASAALIAHNPRKERISKKLTTQNTDGDDILFIHCETGPEEAQAVADKIHSLKTDGAIADFSEVAVLFRSVRSHAGPYFQAFNERDIPYVVIGDGKFLERPDVKDFIHLFSFLTNKKKWADKFLACKTLGLSKETVKTLKRYEGELHTLKTDREVTGIGIENKKDRKKLLILLDAKRKVLDRKHDDILSVFYNLLEAMGCLAAYAKNTEDLLNLALFTSIINDFDDHAGTNNVFYFLRYVDDLGYGAIDEERAELEGAAKIMTVHQAKGLEFPVVVLGAAMEGRFPIKFRGEKYPIPDACLERIESLSEDIHMMDERKLFYVGMTRAKSLLILAAADKVGKRGNGPSRFIAEIAHADNACVSADVCPTCCKPQPRKKAPKYRERKRLSYSGIQTYISCPLRYKYLMECGFKVPQAIFYSFGTSLHNTLEDIHNLAQAGQEVTETRVKELYEENWITFGHRGRKAEEKHKAAGLQYMLEYLRNHKDSFDYICRVEELYTFPSEDFLISGRVDLLRRMPDGALEIVDFKTYKSRWSDHALQLGIYAMACDTEAPVGNLCVHYLREDACDYYSWGEAERKETDERVAAILAGIRAGDFSPNVTDGCTKCEFARICTPYLDSAHLE
jgi:DNA helicase-2/ATP-dependent DNA helicase PcrA